MSNGGEAQTQNFVRPHLTRFIQSIGGLILLLPLIPVAYYFSPLPDQTSFRAPITWFPQIACALLFALSLQKFAPLYIKSRIDDIYKRFINSSNIYFLLISITIQFALTFNLSLYISNGAPFFLDAIVQSFQAKYFAAGHLALLNQPYPEFFTVPNTVLLPSNWFSQFPPGHAALLSIGELLGGQLLILCFTSCATSILLFYGLKNIYDTEIAKLSILLLALASPFFTFMNVSFMNHVTTLFYISAAFRSLTLKNKYFSSSLCGLFCGLTFLTRPLTAVAVILVFGYLIFKPKRIYETLIFGGVVALLIVVGLVYNFETTGSTFISGYEVVWGKTHQLGFHLTPWGTLHTPLRGLREQILNLYLLQDWLFSFPFPALWPLGVFLLLNPRELKTWDLRLLALFALTQFAYFFYWHRDSVFGPRYIYCASVLCAVPLSARAIQSLKTNYPKLNATIVSSLAAFIIFGLFQIIAMQAQEQRFKYSIFRENATELAQANGVKSALIFVAVPWGQRITSQLRAAGFSANLVDAAYLHTDICELDSSLSAYHNNQLSFQALSEYLENASKDQVKPLTLPGNIVVRLRNPNELTQRCIDQINYDAKGYTNYLAHFLENTAPPAPPFIIAIDQRERNQLLIDQYKDLPVYIYRNSTLELL